MVCRSFSYFEVLLIVRVCSCFFLHVSYFMHRFGMYVFFLFWGGGRSRWPSVSSQICVFSLKMSGFQNTCVFHVFFMFVFGVFATGTGVWAQGDPTNVLWLLLCLICCVLFFCLCLFSCCVYSFALFLAVCVFIVFF